jgi:hypothetical protein
MATAYPLNENYNKNAREADTNGHGTHVVSTIIGFSVYGLYKVDGVAPGATIIPVKVLSNAGWGFSTDVAAGIIYVANLFIAEKNSGGNVLPPSGIVNPVIISMSLGGPNLSPLEKAAIDYAINAGVFIVAAAGNEGEKGMSYPGAYEPVISVGAAGWIGEWNKTAWWRSSDVPENLDGQVYVTDFSSRALDGRTWMSSPLEAGLLGHTRHTERHTHQYGQTEYQASTTTWEEQAWPRHTSAGF